MDCTGVASATTVLMRTAALRSSPRDEEDEDEEESLRLNERCKGAVAKDGAGEFLLTCFPKHATVTLMASNQGRDASKNRIVPPRKLFSPSTVLVKALRHQSSVQVGVHVARTVPAEQYACSLIFEGFHRQFCPVDVEVEEETLELDDVDVFEEDDEVPPRVAAIQFARSKQ